MFSPPCPASILSLVYFMVNTVEPERESPTDISPSVLIIQKHMLLATLAMNYGQINSEIQD